MKTITIIGGSQYQTFQQIGEKLGCNILFHSGKKRNGGTKKEFRAYIEKADCVVVLLGACGHVTMDIVKELCKQNDVKIVYHPGMGASGAVISGLRAIG